MGMARLPGTTSGASGGSGSGGGHGGGSDDEGNPWVGVEGQPRLTGDDNWPKVDLDGDWARANLGDPVAPAAPPERHWDPVDHSVETKPRERTKENEAERQRTSGGGAEREYKARERGDKRGLSDDGSISWLFANLKSDTEVANEWIRTVGADNWQSMVWEKASGESGEQWLERIAAEEKAAQESRWEFMDKWAPEGSTVWENQEDRWAEAVRNREQAGYESGWDEFLAKGTSYLSGASGGFYSGIVDASLRGDNWAIAAETAKAVGWEAANFAMLEGGAKILGWAASGASAARATGVSGGMAAVEARWGSTAVKAAGDTTPGWERFLTQAERASGAGRGLSSAQKAAQAAKKEARWAASARSSNAARETGWESAAWGDELGVHGKVTSGARVTTLEEAEKVRSWEMRGASGQRTIRGVSQGASSGANSSNWPSEPGQINWASINAARSRQAAADARASDANYLLDHATSQAEAGVNNWQSAARHLQRTERAGAARATAQAEVGVANWQHAARTAVRNESRGMKAASREARAGVAEWQRGAREGMKADQKAAWSAENYATPEGGESGWFVRPPEYSSGAVSGASGKSAASAADAESGWAVRPAQRGAGRGSSAGPGRMTAGQSRVWRKDYEQAVSRGVDADTAAQQASDRLESYRSRSPGWGERPPANSGAASQGGQTQSGTPSQAASPATNASPAGESGWVRRPLTSAERAARQREAGEAAREQISNWEFLDNLEKGYSPGASSAHARASGQRAYDQAVEAWRNAESSAYRGAYDRAAASGASHAEASAAGETAASNWADEGVDWGAAEVRSGESGWAGSHGGVNWEPSAPSSGPASSEINWDLADDAVGGGGDGWVVPGSLMDAEAWGSFESRQGLSGLSGSSDSLSSGFSGSASGSASGSGAAGRSSSASVSAQSNAAVQTSSQLSSPPLAASELGQESGAWPQVQAARVRTVGWLDDGHVGWVTSGHRGVSVPAVPGAVVRRGSVAEDSGQWLSKNSRRVQEAQNSALKLASLLGASGAVPGSPGSSGYKGSSAWDSTARMSPTVINNNKGERVVDGRTVSALARSVSNKMSKGMNKASATWLAVAQLVAFRDSPQSDMEYQMHKQMKANRDQSGRKDHLGGKEKVAEKVSSAADDLLSSVAPGGGRSSEREMSDAEKRKREGALLWSKSTLLGRPEGRVGRVGISADSERPALVASVADGSLARNRKKKKVWEVQNVW